MIGGCVIVAVLGVCVSRLDPVTEMLGKCRNVLELGMETVTGKVAIELGDEAREKLLKDKVERAMREFESATGRSPRKLEELVSEGKLNPSEIVDEYGRQMKVEIDHQGVTLRSAGKDGKFNTRDDWTFGS